MFRKKRLFFWGALIVLIVLMSALLYVAHYIVAPTVVKESVAKAKLQAQVIEKELAIKFSEQAALTKSLAVIASSIPLNRNSFISNAGILIENSTGIAGGGIWPEPYQLIDSQEKASLFWVKTGDGKFRLDEGYNSPQSQAYQNEFWYQAAKNAAINQCVWSQAYVDPHSNVPMVTCSVRIERDGLFWGVATIDIDLSGVNQRLMEIKAQSGIISFILDKNEQFVATSLPQDHSLLMHSIEKAVDADLSLAPLVEAVHHLDSSFIQLDSSVLGSERSILVVTRLAGQNWHIGVIFPDSIAKKQINLLNDYFYFFIVFLSITFAAFIVITSIIAFWNITLSKTVKSKSDQLVEESFKDSLTGLPNQSGMFAELEQKIRIAKESSESSFAIFFLDIDDFKKQNDRFGLAGGDQLLKLVASRLQSAMRTSDFICRFGGDEFVVITQVSDDKHDAEAVCSHILNTIHEAFLLDGKEVRLTSSIGIACYKKDGDQVNELLRNASIAKREAKNTARNSFSFSSTDMNKRTLRKMVLEEKLKVAIECGEISVAYQPIVDLSTGQPRKFEALARWTNPVLGVVPPWEFIELAEHNGMIIELGDCILKQALTACARMRKRHSRDYMIAVNVSPKQFHDPHFASRVITVLDDLELPHSCLTLEITEGVLIDNKEKSESVIQELCGSGIKIAMDDFGTGYSSLSYIRHYPFDILKIDKEFIDDLVTDPKSKRLVEATLAMASSLDIDVVAEGIEEAEQAELLKQRGCKYAQGYFYARPLNEEALEAWLLESYWNQ
ncbi:EAL domain-containing protein [Vibrio sp. JC009]|uniref:bifunctional diguanylate cyclase/phosphodiesterase n=1 Tax=Vibrio sp. JC009 TaxID=2912314 RepID=UPI0023AFC55C|nr:GGDEF and EAL domain-containing protein [Vibrio sp. JC009]WED22825.1 EAL domain-containing protein [Vibrio sp. JC009]